MINNIVWSLNIDPSGYSSCARSYVKALNNNKRCNVKIAVNNVAKNINNLGIGKEDTDLFSSISVDNPFNYKTIVQHCVPDRLVFRDEFPNIIYTVTETEIQDRWRDICNFCDLIMTPSKFSKELFKRSGVNSRVEVVPHCHSYFEWNPEISPIKIDNLRDFNFLFVGDYTPRKNGDLVVSSFIEKFNGRKDVSLTLKSYFNSFRHKDVENLKKRIRKIINNSCNSYDGNPPVYFYGYPIPEILMPRFMSSFDCLLSPHRCEGWGLCMSQMMALGKIVIGTNYSGNLEFMNKSNSLLIEIKGFEKIGSEMIKINPNYQGKNWAIVDKDDFCDKMGYALSEETSCLKDNAQRSIKDNFSFEKVSDIIIDRLEEI